jgi:hypothetical protein
MIKTFKISLAVNLGQTAIEHIIKTYGSKYKFVANKELTTKDVLVFNMSEYFSKEDLAEYSKLYVFRQFKQEYVSFEISTYSNIVEPPKKPDGAGKTDTVDGKYVTKEEFDAFKAVVVTKEEFDAFKAVVVTKEEFEAVHAEVIANHIETNKRIDELRDLILKVIETIGDGSNKK